MKKILLYIVLISTQIHAQDQTCSDERPCVDHILYTTEHLDFHSNFWINLHHYLYQKAKRIKQNKADTPNPWDAEQAIIDSFSPVQKQVHQTAINYYQEHMIELSLLWDLSLLNAQLSLFQGFNIDNKPYQSTLFKVLNDVAPIYRQKLWPLHHQKNLAVLKAHQSDLTASEAQVIKKMEHFSGKNWPSRNTTRVDLTAYANWAGAYSTPLGYIYISSLDPDLKTSAFVEIVWHEAAHVLFDWESPIQQFVHQNKGDADNRTYRNIWHSVMFYLSGQAVKEYYQSQHKEHIILMRSKKIYHRYLTPTFIQALDAWYQGKSSREDALQKVIKEINRLTELKP